MKQAELATKARVSVPTIGKLEQGRGQKVANWIIARIAQALGESEDAMIKSFEAWRKNAPPTTDEDDEPSTVDRIADAMAAAAAGKTDQIRKHLQTVLSADELESAIRRFEASQGAAAKEAIARRKRKKGLD